MEAKNNNDATLIVVDPRFTRTASVADIYAPIRSGTDITFLSGVLLYLIENKINAGTLSITPMPACWCGMICLRRGLFSGYDAENASTINRHGTTSSMKTATPNAMKRSATRAACGIC